MVQGSNAIAENLLWYRGDLNVDEIHEVIPITEKYGLRHPQEGTVVAHFNASEERKAAIIDQLRKG